MPQAGFKTRFLQERHPASSMPGFKDIARLVGSTQLRELECLY